MTSQKPREETDPSETSVKRPSKRRFRPARAALIVSASILLAVIGLFVLVRFGTFDRLILAEASRRLEAATGLKFEAKGIAVDPFRLAITIEGPVLSASPGQGPALRRFTADEMSVDVPWSLLVGGEPA